MLLEKRGLLFVTLSPSRPDTQRQVFITLLIFWWMPFANVLLSTVQFPRPGLILLHVGMKGLWDRPEADVLVGRTTKLIPLAADGVSLSASQWSVTTQTQTQGEDDHMKTEAEIKVTRPKLVMTWGCQSWKRQRRSFLRGSVGSVAQPISWFWTSHLQNFLENRFLMFQTKINK